MATDRTACQFLQQGAVLAFGPSFSHRLAEFFAAAALLNYGNYGKIITIIAIILERHFKDISWPEP